MIEFIAFIFPAIIPLLFIGIVIFMIWRVGADKPLFKMKCRDCGHKDRNWEVVCTGHDDFAWQHKCLETSE